MLREKKRGHKNQIKDKFAGGASACTHPKANYEVYWELQNQWEPKILTVTED